VGVVASPAVTHEHFCQIVCAAVRGESLDFTAPQSRAFAEDGVNLSCVKDRGRAIALLRMAPRLCHSTYNIGTGKAIRNREFVEPVCRIVPGARFELPAGSDPRDMGGSST
jgi:UDP-glucose 4-epimerase